MVLTMTVKPKGISGNKKNKVKKKTEDRLGKQHQLPPGKKVRWLEGQDETFTECAFDS
jgi:hypothetical protein